MQGGRLLVASLRHPNGAKEVIDPENPQRAFKGVWIPKEIWDDERLTWMEKCLLAEINVLDNGDGCTASNRYLAEKFNSSPASMANIITKLRGLGLIKTMKFNGRIRTMQVKAASTARLRQKTPGDEASINPPVKSSYREKTDERKVEKDPADGGEPPEFQKLIELWTECFRIQFGKDYHFQGAKDATAAKRITVKNTAKLVMDVATAAWARKGNSKEFWACENQTSSLASFVASWNKIREELDRVPHGGLPGHSITRNAGRTPPAGLLPYSQQPPPGTDEQGNTITRDEWRKRFPLSLYYDEETLRPLG